MSSRQLVAGVTRAARPAYAHARPLRLLTPSAARPTVPSSSRLRSLHTSLRRLQKEPDAPQADLPTQTTAAVERKLHDAEAAASFNGECEGSWAGSRRALFVRCGRAG